MLIRLAWDSVSRSWLRSDDFQACFRSVDFRDSSCVTDRSVLRARQALVPVEKRVKTLLKG